MTTSLTLTSTRLADGTRVLTAAGEIDTNNCAQLDAAIRAALEDDADTVVVDLAAVSYLDSAGLGVLFEYAEHVEVVANRLIAPVLAMAGLADVMTVRGLDAPVPATEQAQV